MYKHRHCEKFSPQSSHVKKTPRMSRLVLSHRAWRGGRGDYYWLVWERIVYATLLLRIFCFVECSTFLILKSRLGSITELLAHKLHVLDTIW